MEWKLGPEKRSDTLIRIITRTTMVGDVEKQMYSSFVPFSLLFFTRVDVARSPVVLSRLRQPDLARNRGKTEFPYGHSAKVFRDVSQAIVFRPTRQVP